MTFRLVSESARRARFFKAFTAAAASILFAWEACARASSAFAFPMATAEPSKASPVRARAA